MYAINKMLVGMFLAGMALGAAAADYEMPESRFIAESRVVRFTDLNLDNPADVATLHDRLRAATRKVCLDLDSDLRDVNGMRRLDKCRRESLEAAVKQVPMVVQAHHRQWVAAGAKWTRRSTLPATLDAAIRR